MSTDIDQKLDRLIRLLEDQESGLMHRHCAHSDFKMIREIVLNSVLASAVGYFMFRIMDYHFRAKPKVKSNRK